MSNVADRLAKSSAKAATAKQVRLRLVYIDFWSALKLAFLVTVAVAIAQIVATALVWTVLQVMGFVDRITELLGSILGSTQMLTDWLAFGPLMGFSLVSAALIVVGGTTLGAIMALLYNLSVKITGGLLVGFTNT
jgi:hypothetical protein